MALDTKYNMEIQGLFDIISRSSQIKAKKASNVFKEELGNRLIKVVLFGSVGKKRQSRSSDIDLGLVLADGASITEVEESTIKMRLKALEIELGEGKGEIHLQLISQSEFSSRRSTDGIVGPLRGGIEI